MCRRQGVRYWIGKLKVYQGELEHSASVLLATHSLDGAFAALDVAARSYYGSEDDPPRSDEKYESHGGGVIVSPMSVRQIPEEVFQALRADTMVRLGDGVTAQDIEPRKLPSAAQSLGLLEAMERYIQFVDGGGAGEADGSRASKLLARCKEQVGQVRQSFC